MKRLVLLSLCLTLLFTLGACGSGDQASKKTAAPTPKPMAAAVGSYEMETAASDDAVENLLLDLMGIMDMKTTLRLDADGSGEIVSNGVHSPVTWDEYKIDTGDGNPGTWRYENGTLHITAEGEQLTFKRTDN